MIRIQIIRDKFDSKGDGWCMGEICIRKKWSHNDAESERSIIYPVLIDMISKTEIHPQLFFHSRNHIFKISHFFDVNTIRVRFETKN